MLHQLKLEKEKENTNQLRNTQVDSVGKVPALCVAPPMLNPKRSWFALAVGVGVTSPSP